MIAFVFSGGGNRGAVQAGAAVALIERGIYPDVIVGTSAGALNGVTLAAEPSLAGARRNAETWQHIRGSDIFPGNPFTVGWRILTRQGSLHHHACFQRFVRGMLPPHVRLFEDLRVPCLVTATVLGTGQLRLFGVDPKEPLVEALLASTAIPPFFPPYRYGDEWLVDGAVVANLPIEVALARGARTIYALDIVDEVVSISGRSLAQTLSVSMRAMITQRDALELRIAALNRQRGIVIHDIKLAAGQPLAYNDFSHGSRLVEAGYRAACDYLDTLPPPQPVYQQRVVLALRGAWSRVRVGRELTAQFAQRLVAAAARPGVRRHLLFSPAKGAKSAKS